jgi:transposase InsO family protein
VLADGRRFRVLVIVDNFTRECLALVADTSLSSEMPELLINLAKSSAARVELPRT